MKSERKEKLIKIQLLVINILIPFCVVIISLSFVHGSIKECRPAWGDEVWWWQQANAVSEYGCPLGYWGYNGGKAPIGTFATWGPAMVFPYGLFAALFGWGYNSYIYANFLYLGLAVFLFVFLAKPGNKELFMFTLCNLFMVVKNYFVVTAMAECVRYALGIIAAALLLFLYRRPKCHWAFRCIFLPLFLFYITQAYLIFGVFWFFYMLCILGEDSAKLKYIIALVSTGIFVFVSRKILRLFSSPYISVGESNNSLTETVMGNLKMIGNIYISEDVFFKWFLTMYFILCSLLFVRLLTERHKMLSEDKILYMGAFIVLGVYLGGHITLYDGMAVWTLIRGLSVGLVISVFFLCLARDKLAVYVFLSFALLGSFTWGNVFTTFYNENRFQTMEWKTALSETSESLEKVLDINEHTENPWENTIATYQAKDLQIGLALPKGFAINTMLDCSCNNNAKYAVVGKTVDKLTTETLILELEAAGFVKEVDNEYMIILEKQ